MIIFQLMEILLKNMENIIINLIFGIMSDININYREDGDITALYDTYIYDEIN